MATHPIYLDPSTDQKNPSGQTLAYEDGWELIMSLSGSAKGMYDEFGGVEKYVAQMRSDEPIV